MDESDDEDGLDAFFSGVSLHVNDLPAPVDVSTDATDNHLADDDEDDDIFNKHQKIVYTEFDKSLLVSSFLGLGRDQLTPVQISSGDVYTT
jgi:hypothetical protein